MLSKVKKETINLLVLFLLLVVIFKIVYLKEGFVTIIRTVSSIFWIFIIPGFYLMYYWHEKLDFGERLVIGVGLSAAIVGISSYYFGLIGLNVKYHTILLPALLLAIASLVIFRKKDEN